MTKPARMLEAVGLTDPEETVYRVLLGAPRATQDEIEQRAELAGGVVAAVLDGLEARGLVSRLPGAPARFLPAPPDVAIEGLVHRRQVELEQTRILALALKEEFRVALQRDNPADLIEVVTGSEAIGQQFEQLQRTATSEMVIFDAPPYIGGDDNELEFELLRRGVHYRTLYAVAALDVEGYPDAIGRWVAAGEKARVLETVPLKLAIADRRRGLVPLAAADPGDPAAVIVHASALLDALGMLFDILWERAVPFSLVPSATDPLRPAELSPDDARLLGFIAAGLKDEVIARELGIGLRTVRRRIAALMRELGAVTRFQAGAQAVRRGWL